MPRQIQQQQGPRLYRFMDLNDNIQRKLAHQLAQTVRETEESLLEGLRSDYAFKYTGTGVEVGESHGSY